ncbi:aminopeptidase [Brevibacillus centrosporus]
MKQATQWTNDNVVHEDFMSGADQLDIDGELADGTREPLLRQGTWVLFL